MLRILGMCLKVGVCVLFCCLSIAGCGGDDQGGQAQEGAPAPKKAPIDSPVKAVWDEARQLAAAGKTLEAARKYDEMMNFPDDPFLEEAKAILLKEGISLGDAVRAWTINRLFLIKNRLITEGQIRHPEGNATVPVKDTDSWGTEIWVMYGRNDKWLFAVISAGPDKIFKTEDDLSLFQKVSGGMAKKPAEAPAAPEGEPEKPKPPEEQKSALDHEKVEKKHRRAVVDDFDLAGAPKKAEASPEPAGKTEPPPQPQSPPEPSVVPSPKAPTETPAVEPGPSGEASVDLEDLLKTK